MIQIINAFINFITQNPIELYGEFGLQHELSLFLRQNYPELTVRLEYPTSRLGFNPLPNFIKKEIDIYVRNENGESCVIELKMPKDNCGTPNEMYSAIKDVKFLEELKNAGIDYCFSILFTDRRAFWQAKQANAGIYNFFNGVSVNIQTLKFIHMPNFLHRRGTINIIHNHQSHWQNYTDSENKNWKYYIIEIP